MPSPTRYLTVSEVVQRLADHGVTVTTETVRRWAKSGRLPAKRLLPGRQFRIAVEDVDALIVDVAA